MRVEGGEDLAPPAEPEGDGWWWKVWRAGAISVLVVSESPLWRDEMATLLHAEGYAVRLDERGDAALEPSCPFDIAVVDLAITGRSAAAVFAALRSRSSLPILAVSPQGHREPAILEAYAAGVDQFVTTSLRPRELMARIRALLRRSPPRPRGMIALDTGGTGAIRLDAATGVAMVGGLEVPLTPYESEILYALLQRPGSVVTRDKLAGHGRGRHGDRTLDSLVRSLRQKLESAEGKRRIIAVRGVGFRLLPDAELGASTRLWAAPPGQRALRAAPTAPEQRLDLDAEAAKTAVASAPIPIMIQTTAAGPRA